MWATSPTMSDQRSASASPRRIPKPASTDSNSDSQPFAACIRSSACAAERAIPARLAPLGGLLAVTGLVVINP